MSSYRDPQPLSLDDARDWYEAVRESILAHRGLVLMMLRNGSQGGPGRFFGLSRDEIENEFDAQLAELESATVMTLMASAEGRIRIDYNERVTGNYKDTLSKSYRAFHKTLTSVVQRRPPFDEGILEALKLSAVMANHLIGNFRDALRLRHWLAHGRYWYVTLGRSSYRPDDIYRISYALLSMLPP